MGDMKSMFAVLLICTGAHAAQQVNHPRGLKQTTQLLDSQVGLGNSATNYGGTGVKAEQTEGKKAENGQKSLMTGAAMGNTLTAFGTTQVGTFQYTAVGNGTQPLLQGEAGVVVGGYPVGVSASTNALPTVITKISHPAVDYAGLVKSVSSSDTKSEEPVVKSDEADDDDSASTEASSSNAVAREENAYTRVSTDAGRKLKFIPSPPDSTSGYTFKIGQDEIGETQGNFQTYAGPNKMKSYEVGYTAGLAANAANTTLLGDFLNGALTNNVEQSPLPILSGQGGLVVASQPGGVGVSTANLFSPELITNLTQIVRPAVEYLPGRRLMGTLISLTTALKGAVLNKLHQSATNP